MTWWKFISFQKWLPSLSEVDLDLVVFFHLSTSSMSKWMCLHFSTTSLNVWAQGIGEIRKRKWAVSFMVIDKVKIQSEDIFWRNCQIFYLDVNICSESMRKNNQLSAFYVMSQTILANIWWFWKWFHMQTKLIKLIIFKLSTKRLLKTMSSYLIF